MLKKGRYSDFEKDRNGLLVKGERIVIPFRLRNKVMTEFHGQNHLGIENTVIMLKNRFHWWGMVSDVKKFVKSCRTCSKCKRHELPKAKMELGTSPPKPLQRLAIDFASMPTSSEGYNSFLVMVDANSKLHAVAVCKDQKGATVVAAIWTKWIAYHGVPYEIISDQGQSIDGEYEPGDEVILKRNYGEFPKINPIWIEGPYHIIRQVGPVNYAVANPKGKTKVLHHDMIKPAEVNRKASVTPTNVMETSGIESDWRANLPLSTPVGIQVLLIPKPPSEVATSILANTSTSSVNLNISDTEVATPVDTSEIIPDLEPIIVESPRKQPSGPIPVLQIRKTEVSKAKLPVPKKRSSRLLAKSKTSTDEVIPAAIREALGSSSEDEPADKDDPDADKDDPDYIPE